MIARIDNARYHYRFCKPSMNVYGNKDGSAHVDKKNPEPIANRDRICYADCTVALTQVLMLREGADEENGEAMNMLLTIWEET